MLSQVDQKKLKEFGITMYTGCAESDWRRQVWPKGNKLFINWEWLIKVAYTSGPIFEKNMKRYPIFSVQIINNQIVQNHK